MVALGDAAQTKVKFAANATVDAVGSTVAQGKNVEMLAVTEIEGGVISR